MKYDEHYSNLFDVAHDLLEDIAGYTDYCSHDGHVHDPYKLVKHKKLFKETDYYCKRCDQRFSTDDVSKAKMLWRIVKNHFEGFKPLIWDDRDYKIYLSRGNRKPRIELVAKKREEYLDEGMPKSIVIESQDDLENLSSEFSKTTPGDATE